MRSCGNARNETIDRRHVEYLVNEDVGAMREPDQVVGGKDVARDDHRAVVNYLR